MRSSLLLVLLLGLSLPCLGQRKVLLEHYTSSWCGECANAHWAAQELQAAYPNLILAFHHSSADPMANEHSTEWRQAFQIPGTPLGLVNRSNNGGGPLYLNVGQWEENIAAALALPDLMGLSLSASPAGNGQEVRLQVEANLLSPLPQGEIRLSVLLLEDYVSGEGPAWNQSNYYHNVPGHPLFGLGGSIEGYEHRHVVRDIWPGTWGAADFLPAEAQAGDSYFWEGRFFIPEEARPEFLKAVAVVHRYLPGSLSAQEVLEVEEIALGPVLVSTSPRQAAHAIDFDVSPNPAAGSCSIRLPDGLFCLTLANAQGQPVKEWAQASNGQRLELPELPNGLYLMRAANGGRYATKKLLIQRF